MSQVLPTPLPIFAQLDRLKQAKVTDLDHLFKKQTRPGFVNRDYQLACDFLFSYRGSEATFNTYRRELERLLQWAWFIKNVSVLSLKRQDIESFIEFSQKPPASWIGFQHVPRFAKAQDTLTPNPDWRPFVVQIPKKKVREGHAPALKDFTRSQASIQGLFAVLSSFYQYLIQEEITETNPISQIRQKSKYLRKSQSTRIIRRLSELQWHYVIETAEQLAAQNPEQHERTLFIMNALYSLYLRISELAESDRWQPQMGDFYRDQDGFWWFGTVGKGNKQRMISVSDDMLNALKRYRQSLGLSALPSPGETTPLITNSRTGAAIKSTRAIRKIVQQCFDEAVFRMQKDNLGEEAETLMTATVHWLRHTGISEDVKIRPREHVRDDAGHSSSAITDRYIDIELRERAQSARNKKIKG